MKLYGDEVGVLGDFSGRTGDRYFGVVTAAIEDDACLDELVALGKRLAAELGIPQLAAEFHAAKDRREVKRRVYRLISQHRIRIDATFVEKAHLPHLLRREMPLYRTMWSRHLVRVLPELTPGPAELRVMAASVGTAAKLRRFRAAVETAVNDADRELGEQSGLLGVGVLGKMRLGVSWTRAVGEHAQARAEPGLQVADYCGWALRRCREYSEEEPWARDSIKHLVASDVMIEL